MIACRYRLRPIALLLFGVALSACGALGGAGGGADNLPASGSGPFSPLDPSNAEWSSLNAPFVLSDSGADLDSPFVLARGDALSLWVTATRMPTTDIERADAAKLETGFGDLVPVLTATQQWERGAVSSPSVIAGDPIVPAASWVMFYSAGDAINFATSVNGAVWTKSIGPTLRANNQEEGGALSAPAAVRIGHRLRVYYVASGAIWAAETSYDDVAAMRTASWTRLDGDDTTARRDPIVARPSWATGVSSVSARVALTPAGRERYDVYFTATMAAYLTMTAKSGCGFASSYDGDDFATATAPILSLANATKGPTETPYRAGALLLFVEESGSRQAIAAATSP